MIPPIEPPTVALIASTAAALALGVLAGLVFFTMLWRATQLLVSGGSPLTVVALHVLRLALVGGVLVLAAWLGALPLVGAAGGFLAARYLAVRGVGTSS